MPGLWSLFTCPWCPRRNGQRKGISQDYLVLSSGGVSMHSMPRRPSHQRKIKQGQFVDWLDHAPLPDEVAQRADLRGNTEHKTYPSQFGPPAIFSDKTKCDRYRNEDWPRLVEALRLAIQSRSVGIFRGDFPSRAWVWINGVLHEARLENQELGHYHGFPLDPPDYPLPMDRLKGVPHVEIPVA